MGQTEGQSLAQRYARTRAAQGNAGRRELAQAGPVVFRRRAIGQQGYRTKFAVSSPV